MVTGRPTCAYPESQIVYRGDMHLVYLYGNTQVENDTNATIVVFWPVFQKVRLPSEKGTFSAVSKGHD